MTKCDGITMKYHVHKYALQPILQIFMYEHKFEQLLLLKQKNFNNISIIFHIKLQYFTLIILFLFTAEGNIKMIHRISGKTLNGSNKTGI